MKKDYNLFIPVLAILLLASTSLALTYVGDDDEGSLVFSGEKLVFKVNPTQNKFLIDNIVPLKIFPKIDVEGKEMKTPSITFRRPDPGERLSVYSVKTDEGFVEDVYTKVKLSADDKRVVQEIDIENTKDEEVLVKLSLTDTQDDYYVYAPFSSDPSKNYLIISPQERQMYGRLLIVYFQPYPPSFPLPSQPIQINPTNALVWAIKIPGKSKYKMSISYLSGYLADSNIVNQYPVKAIVDKEPFLITEVDPLIKIYNLGSFDNLMPNLDLSKGSIDIYNDITNYVNSLPSGDPEFGLVSFVDWSVISAKQSYNSLEKALIFREICRKVGIPASLHIGKKGRGNYYAWVVSYVGGVKRIYDPFNSRTDYPTVYKEPDPYLCKDDIRFCRFEQAVRVGIVCIGPICINVILIGIIILALILAGFVFVFYKTEMISKFFIEKPVRRLMVDGSYDIVKPEHKPVDPLLMEVLEYIKSKSGVVDVEEMSHKLGYSKILIISAIEKLVEDGVLVKR